MKVMVLFLCTVDVCLYRKDKNEIKKCRKDEKKQAITVYNLIHARYNRFVYFK